MASVSLVVATVQQLLSQTTALLQQNGRVIVEEGIIETLERDTRLAMMQMRRIRSYSPAIPINRLPLEVLCMVFAHLRHQPIPRRLYGSSTSSSRFASYKPLVAAMLVCHKWHTVASEAPSLWTDTDLEHQDTFAPVLLNRSQGTSIHLCGRLHDGSMLHTIVTNNATRIRELDIFGGRGFFDPNPAPMLQAILAVNLPRVRVLSVSCPRRISTTEAPVLLINTLARLPAVKAMFLKHILFVPAYILPQLTHLCLFDLNSVEIPNILDLLRNAPTLETLDIIHCDESLELPHHPAARTSLSVSLPRLHSVYIKDITFAMSHHLLTSLEAANLAFLELQRVTVLHPRDGILGSTPLFPTRSTLTTRMINRLALDFGDQGFACTAHHENDFSLMMNITTYLSEAENRAWLFDDFPTMLPLPGVEEFHFQAFEWEAAMDLLPHLATRMPMVSTLFLKHHAERDDQDEEGFMDLALAVVAILEGDAGSPGLFPNLAHLELIVKDIPLELCELLVPALAQRDRDGRRLRKLRIRVDSEHSSAWKERWTHGEPEPNYEETGIFDHVDSGEIYPRQRGDSVYDGDSDDDGPGEHSNTLGWGKWKDCAQRRVYHGYWQV